MALTGLSAAVSVDDEEPVAPELVRVLVLQIVADVVCLVGVVHHDEEDRLLAQGPQLLPVLPPALHARREVRLVAGAGDI